MSTDVLPLPQPAAVEAPVPDHPLPTRPFGLYPLSRCMELFRTIPEDHFFGWMLFLQLQSQDQTFHTRRKVDLLAKNAAEEPGTPAFAVEALDNLTARLRDEVINIRAAMRTESNPESALQSLSVMSTTITQLRLLVGTATP